MTPNFYKTHNDEYFKGKRVVLLKELRNGYAVLAKGTFATIEYKRSGFRIRSEKCKCCGVSIIIGKVPPEDLDIVSSGA